MPQNNAPEINGVLRKFALRIPALISESSGIEIFGKKIKSVLFSTDVSIIANVNADAIIAVYPFTPQPRITSAVMSVADIPVFTGVGGGLTQGKRVINLAMFAEMQGAIGVVVNAPTSNEVIEHVANTIDIPVVVTIVSDEVDINSRISAGAAIFNVSAAADTPRIVDLIRKTHPDFPIIATGGSTEESIKATIAAGANAITWTPPSSGEIFKGIMQAYRENKPHP
jgi:DNA-binding NarL/FixJ family response regulator